MPKKSRVSRKRSKVRPLGRRFRPDVATRNYKTLMFRGVGLPDSFMTKLRYTQVVSLTAGALTPYQQYQFRGNSLFDPDFTGGGSQPVFFDNLLSTTGPWTQYLVTASKIACRLSAVGDTFAIGNADVSVTPSNVAFASTNWADIDDQSSMRRSRNSVTTRMDGAGNKWIKNYCTTRDIFDIKKKGDISTNQGAFAASAGGSPAGVWYWIIGAQGMDRTSTTMNVNVKVVLTYYVKCFNLYEAAES